MKLGISIRNFGWFEKRGGAEDQVRIAERAEQLGFDAVWAHDHLVMPARHHARYPESGFGARQDIYDPIAMLSGIAARTKQIKLGFCVLVIPYRNPLVLAKMLATLDCLSSGRVILGAGAGWMQDEFETLEMGERFRIRWTVTDEWLRICVELWTGEGASSYQGRFHSFESIGAFPKSVQKPHIPIWLGSYGGPRAAQRAAQYASGYYTLRVTAEELAAELDNLRRELDSQGRNLDEMDIAMYGGIRVGEPHPRDVAVIASGTKDKIIDDLMAYERAGLKHLAAVPTSGDPTRETPQRLLDDMQYVAEEIMPAVSG